MASNHPDEIDSQKSENSPEPVGKKCKRKDEGKPAMSKHELACIFDFLDTNYQALYGRNKAANYDQNRDDAWKDLVNAVNKVHNGIYNRTLHEVEKKIDNSKNQGWYLLIYNKSNQM